MLGLMEEIRDDKINELVGAMQSWIRGYRAREAYSKLYFERKGLLCAQMTIRWVLSVWMHLISCLFSLSRHDKEIQKCSETKL